MPNGTFDKLRQWPRYSSQMIGGFEGESMSCLVQHVKDEISLVLL